MSNTIVDNIILSRGDVGIEVTNPEKVLIEKNIVRCSGTSIILNKTRKAPEE